MLPASRRRSEDPPLRVGVVEQSLPAAPGVETEFVELYREIHQDAMDHALMFLDRDSAWDAVHEAIADIWKRWDKLSPEQRTRAYFYGAIHHHVLRHMKDAKRHVELADAEHQLSRLAIESIDQATGEPKAEVDPTPILDRIIGEMPPRRREVFVLIRERDLSYKEVADLLGISVASVNTHLTLAHEFVRTEMNRAGFPLAAPSQKALPPAKPEVHND